MVFHQKKLKIIVILIPICFPRSARLWPDFYSRCSVHADEWHGVEVLLPRRKLLEENPPQIFHGFLITHMWVFKGASIYQITLVLVHPYISWHWYLCIHISADTGKVSSKCIHINISWQSRCMKAEKHLSFYTLESLEDCSNYIQLTGCFLLLF